MIDIVYYNNKKKGEDNLQKFYSQFDKDYIVHLAHNYSLTTGKLKNKK